MSALPIGAQGESTRLGDGAHATLDSTVCGTRGVVASPDRLASAAGMQMLVAGGSAADAAIATNAVLAITAQHMCGLGGDLVAVARRGEGTHPQALLAVGYTGSGASAAAVAADGLAEVPAVGDVRSVSVPGCVDGWIALHSKFGLLPLEVVLGPAIELATEGFAVPPPLARALSRVADRPNADDMLGAGVPNPGERRRMPGVARALREIAADGRDAWYLGEFGDSLLHLGDGLFERQDLRRPNATWHDAWSLQTPLGTLFTPPPPSQGYITLLAAALLVETDVLSASTADLARQLLGAARAAGHDRFKVLGETSPDVAFLSAEMIAERTADAQRGAAGPWAPPTVAKDTIGLCAIDDSGFAVAMCQSNASGFGSRIAVPGLGVWLHNRAAGMSIEAGSPNVLRPRARPAHTLAPVLAHGTGGAALAALATRGGDTQPQVLLQLLAHLHRGDTPGAALTRARWTLGSTGAPVFSSWPKADGATASPLVRLESSAPIEWADELRSTGHRVELLPTSGDFGQAQVALADRAGQLCAAADPRAEMGAAIAW